jgi:hypothetical protein
VDAAAGFFMVIFSQGEGGTGRKKGGKGARGKRRKGQMGKRAKVCAASVPEGGRRGTAGNRGLAGGKSPDIRRKSGGNHWSCGAGALRAAP